MKRMKLISVMGVLMIAMLCLFGTGCTKDDSEMLEWDVAPVEVIIRVVDAQGNDLLNPNTPGTIAHNKITAEYEGKNYEMDTVANKPRAILPIFYGLYCEKPKTSDEYLLYFGELDGAETFQKEVTIDWKDGTKDVITILNVWKVIDPYSKNGVFLERKVQLNGKEVDYDKIMIDGYWRQPPITIVK